MAAILLFGVDADAGGKVERRLTRYIRLRPGNSPHACQSRRNIGLRSAMTTLFRRCFFCVSRGTREVDGTHGALRMKRDRVAAGMDRQRPSLQSRNLEANGIRRSRAMRTLDRRPDTATAILGGLK
jgi:hypothetical protein